MANRWWVNQDNDNNWHNANNWATTEGGAGGAGIPTSSDDVYFSKTSSPETGGSLCQLTTDGVCGSISTRTNEHSGTDNWDGTLDLNGYNLTVGFGTGSGNVDLDGIDSSNKVTLKLGTHSGTGSDGFKFDGTFNGYSNCLFDLQYDSRFTIHGDFFIDITQVTNDTGDLYYMTSCNTYVLNGWFSTLYIEEGITVTATGNCVYTRGVVNCKGSYIYGTLNMQNNALRLGSGRGGNGVFVIGDNADIQGTNVIALRVGGESTISVTNNELSFAGTIKYYSSPAANDTRIIPDFNMPYASLELNEDNTGDRNIYFYAGNHIYKELYIESGLTSNITITNDTDNPNIEIKEKVDLTNPGGTVTYNKGTGSFTLSESGETGADHNIDFNNSIIEDLIINSNEDTKTIVSNFETESLTLTSGILNRQNYTIIVQGATSLANGILIEGSDTYTSSNLLDNGDFEETGGTTGWSAVNGGSIGIVSDDPPDSDGQYAVEITGPATGSNGTFIRQDISVTAGKTYYISCFIKNIDMVFANLRIQNGDFSITGGDSENVSSTDWTYASVVVKAKDSTLRVSIYGNQSGASQQCRADNFIVEEVTGLICKGTFDTTSNTTLTTQDDTQHFYWDNVTIDSDTTLTNDRSIIHYNEYANTWSMGVPNNHAPYGFIQRHNADITANSSLTVGWYGVNINQLYATFNCGGNDVNIGSRSGAGSNDSIIGENFNISNCNELQFYFNVGVDLQWSATQTFNDVNLIKFTSQNNQNHSIIPIKTTKPVQLAIALGSNRGFKTRTIGDGILEAGSIEVVGTGANDLYLTNEQDIDFKVSGDIDLSTPTAGYNFYYTKSTETGGETWTIDGDGDIDFDNNDIGNLVIDINETGGEATITEDFSCDSILVSNGTLTCNNTFTTDKITMNNGTLEILNGNITNATDFEANGGTLKSDSDGDTATLNLTNQSGIVQNTSFQDLLVTGNIINAKDKTNVDLGNPNSNTNLGNCIGLIYFIDFFNSL